MSKTERTYIMVKPDGVQRGLIGEIIKRFEQKGFKLVAMKFMQVPARLLGTFSRHVTLYFFVTHSPLRNSLNSTMLT